MCISWTRKGLISLMHGVTMKSSNSRFSYQLNAQLRIKLVIENNCFYVSIVTSLQFGPVTVCEWQSADQ